MLAIERGASNVAVALTEQDKLAGIITDGDVRRALLAGHALHDQVAPHLKTAPVVCAVSDSRNSVLDMMRSRGIAQVPVVDDDGRVVGLHLMGRLLTRSARANIAVVLAGGRGQRLRPLTDSIPKPMVRVAGRPILERIVDHLVGYGIQRIVMAVGYMPEVIEEHFRSGQEFGCSISYVRESELDPRGTGGPLAAVHQLFPENQDPVLVINGDLITQFNADSLLAHHDATDSEVTVAGFAYEHEVPYGVLAISNDASIIGLTEKPTLREWVNAGIYVVARDLLRLVPPSGFVPMTTLLSDWLSRGTRMTMWELENDWIDVGVPVELARARGEA